MSEYPVSIAIDDQEFKQFQQLLLEKTGIFLSPVKKPLLTGRLNRRLRELGVRSYADYYRAIVLEEFPDELQILINCLTTNETAFFREPRHFDFLRDLCGRPEFLKRMVRVWCAAASSGEEPYSIAMVLADTLRHDNWELIASDVNSEVLDQARVGYYALQRGADIPKHYLQRYCLKGVGQHAGAFVIGPELRGNIRFQRINLVEPLPALGQFDVIFLRNALIYFPADIKLHVIEQTRRFLKLGGHFIVGHSETLLGTVSDFKPVSPSIYRRI
ncbi:MAG: protein-glutamate O-methyltransferase CheR [Methylococcaceae bacterium]|nr:MAG: protein-glutamate O-methyltransferase CheR [Methylococcaceae bacterium]